MTNCNGFLIFGGACWRAIPAMVLSACLVGGNAGCSNLFNQHAQILDAVRGMSQEAVSRLGESGFGQAQASASVINPGVKVEAGVSYFATARYEGVSGQLATAQQGKLDRPVSDAKEQAAIALWRNTSLSDAEKLAFFKALIEAKRAEAATSQPGEVTVIK